MAAAALALYNMVQIDRQNNGFVYYAMPRCDACRPLTPRHKNARCAAMTIRPYKPRDSARSALLTTVRSRRSGLACRPPQNLRLSVDR